MDRTILTGKRSDSEYLTLEAKGMMIRITRLTFCRDEGRLRTPAFTRARCDHTFGLNWRHRIWMKPLFKS